jgi:hypothetical protein
LLRWGWASACRRRWDDTFREEPVIWDRAERSVDTGDGGGGTRGNRLRGGVYSGAESQRGGSDTGSEIRIGRSGHRLKPMLQAKARATKNYLAALQQVDFRAVHFAIRAVCAASALAEDWSSIAVGGISAACMP